ncbi:MAG: CoA transferase [Chloroflexi bacterium]|nr:CoA transferase [Chloroflexota bacterium]
MAGRAMAGVRIVDLAEVHAGPLGATLLADLGADVIKVESYPRNSLTRPLRPDARVADGPGPPYERTAPQTQSNRNKRFVALNIRAGPGADVLHRLLDSADVLVEGYAAGTIQRLGFSWDVVHERHPRLTMISMPAWGVRGPYFGYVALGSGVEGTTGHLRARGLPAGGVEDIASTVATDASAPLAVAFASIAALRRREETGEGSFIDLSHAEAFSWYLAGLLGEEVLAGRRYRGQGNADPYVVPHGCYRASGDGPGGSGHWVAIAAETDAQWAGLASLLGHPEWADDGHPWASIAGRLAGRIEIDGILASFVRGRDRWEVADVVQRAGAIAAPVLEPSAMLASPQLQARSWFVPVMHRYLGERLMPGFLTRVAPDAPAWERPAGLVGEHNEEVLSELGYAPAAIAALRAAGVIGDGYGGAGPPAAATAKAGRPRPGRDGGAPPGR